MPAYKTHAIYGELVLPKIDKKVEIKKEDIKIFSFGPDALIPTDYKLFEYQHNHKVKLYFEAILKYIKKNKLQDNSEVMAFLYGQLDHYVLDCFTHPLIYYMTEDVDSKHFMNQHALVEMWLDDYVMEKYDKNDKFYFKKNHISDKNLLLLINKVYKKVYNSSNEANKYNLGIMLMTLLDAIGRDNYNLISPLILTVFNIGNITFNKSDRVIPYLNLNHEKWTNPVNGEIYTDSFDDLWDKSIEVYLETINDVNKYLYLDKKFYNSLISQNISYNTGFPCKKREKFVYIKKYLKRER